MTEAAHQMTSNPLHGKRKPGSVGIGQGVEVRILDQEGKEVAQGKEGEISIRGENVTKGYLNNDKANKEAFTADGFFRTGDQGKMDEERYVIITGRIKELINKGGEKISPIELDNTVAQHPKVSEAVSFAIPDEMYGQDVGVAVVLKDGQKMTPDELKKWMTEKVAKFKVPKKVSFVLDLLLDLRLLMSNRSSLRMSCPRRLRARCREEWSPLPWKHNQRPSSDLFFFHCTLLLHRFSSSHTVIFHLSFAA